MLKRERPRHAILRRDENLDAERAGRFMVEQLLNVDRGSPVLYVRALTRDAARHSSAGGQTRFCLICESAIQLNAQWRVPSAKCNCGKETYADAATNCETLLQLVYFEEINYGSAR
jgi:hypothetical protein